MKILKLSVAENVNLISGNLNSMWVLIFQPRVGHEAKWWNNSSVELAMFYTSIEIL